MLRTLRLPAAGVLAAGSLLALAACGSRATTIAGVGDPTAAVTPTPTAASAIPADFPLGIGMEHTSPVAREDLNRDLTEPAGCTFGTPAAAALAGRPSRWINADETYRGLFVLPDAAAAARVVDHAADLVTHCAHPDGDDTIKSVALSSVLDGHAFAWGNISKDPSGAITNGGGDVWVLLQAGNAVVLETNLVPGYPKAATVPTTADYQAVADELEGGSQSLYAAMATTFGGAAEPSPAPTSPAPTSPAPTSPAPTSPSVALEDRLPHADDLIELSEVKTPWATGPASSGLPATWLDSCRPAKAAPVATGWSQAAYRTFTQPHGGRAQAVVLHYPSASAAQASYQDLEATYQACPDLIAHDGGSVSRKDVTPIDLGAFGSGPNDAEAKSFLVSFSSPAIVDAQKEEQHGIAIDGSDLLVATVERYVQEYWPDLQMSMPRIVERFGQTSGLPRTVAYDTQLDYVRIGESYGDAMASGSVGVCAPDAGQVGYCVKGWDPSGNVCLSKTRGIEAIFLPANVATTAGLRADQHPTLDDVRRLYPNVTGEADLGEYHVPLRSGTSYLIDVSKGVVTQIILQEDDQDCYD